MKYNRATIPQKVMDLLFSDDSFYNDVTGNKKIVINKYPRSDQWVDEEGLNMSFALAGYSPEDIKVSVSSSSVTIENVSKLKESNAMQKGLIVRGIAKRNFSETVYVHSNFDVGKIAANMSNGLLNIKIPFSENNDFRAVEIK